MKASNKLLEERSSKSLISKNQTDFRSDSSLGFNIQIEFAETVKQIIGIGLLWVAELENSIKFVI